VKYIEKVAEEELWNAGKVELWDFSRANQNEESRVEAVATVASICYRKPPKDAKKLVERLWTESGGLPSSAFEFVRAGDPKQIEESCAAYEKYDDVEELFGIPYSLRNCQTLLSNERWINQNNVMQEELIKWHKEEIATFRLTVPIFLARQIMHHRQFSYQELSRRYTTDKQVPFRFWTSEDLRAYRPGVSYEGVVDMATELYQILTEDGVRPEIAHAVLPQSLYATFWMMGDSEAWANYFRLRLDKHTQKEHRELAQAMLDLLEEHQPELWRKVKP